MPAAPGLTAVLHGTPVLVVDVFRRRCHDNAHAVPIMRTRHKNPPAGATFVLDRRHASTCLCNDLGDVSLGWEVVGFSRRSVYMKPAAPAGEDVVVTSQLQDCWEEMKTVAASCIDVRLPEPASLPASTDVHVVLSAAARQHLVDFPGHVLAARGRIAEPTFVSDIPVPTLLDLRLRRCETCQKDGYSTSFHPSAEDVVNLLPHLVMHEGAQHYKRKRYMTREYLFNLLQCLYESFNLRAVRRSLLRIMSASLLSQMLRGQGAGVSPTSIGAAVLAVPTPQELQCVALKAFQSFVQKQADVVMQRQCLYNLSIIRGDGHYDVASRVYRSTADGKRDYPFTCLLGWCGADGSLLKPFVLAAGEAFEDQVQDLEPFLRFAKRVRQAHGMSSSDSRPTFHATDTYNKHRLLWPQV